MIGIYGYKSEFWQMFRTSHYVFVLVSCRTVHTFSVPAFNRTLTKFNALDLLIRGDVLRVVLEHTKFRRRGITQKKAYKIHNTAKV
jgi:hypothetical protein